MRATRLVVVFLFTLLVAPSVTFAEKRVALVIGNDSYATLSNLANARTDARGVAAKLGALGFEVILRLNASERSMVRAMREFEGKLSSARVGLVFYAGHGVQVDGRNYLIPSDARVEVENDLESEAIDAWKLLEAMKRAGSPLNIVILDACRDNPLPQRTRSAARGLANMPLPVGLKGTAIVYSAAPGQRAQDGPAGGHGLFTGELLQVLDQPGLTLESVFKKTAARVAIRTNYRQDPWMNSSVKTDFYFRPPSVGVKTLDQEMWARKTTNVRAEPSVASQRIGRLRAGDTVGVTGVTRVGGDTWYRVALSGRGVGYVLGTLLTEQPAGLSVPRPIPSKPSRPPTVEARPSADKVGERPTGKPLDKTKCRTAEYTVTVKGRTTTESITMCQDADGNWKAVP